MIKISKLTFTFENTEVPKKRDIWKRYQIPSLLQSLLVNFPPIIHMAPLKFVPSPSCLALMSSFRDPIFTLQVSFLDIQGPYSHLAFTWGRIPPIPNPTPRTSSSNCAQLPEITPSSHRWEALGMPGYCAPRQSRLPRLSSPLSGTKLRRPPGARGSCKVARSWLSVLSVSPGSGRVEVRERGMGWGRESLGWSRGRLGIRGHSLLVPSLPTENRLKEASSPLLFNHPS